MRLTTGVPLSLLLSAPLALTMMSDPSPWARWLPRLIAAASADVGTAGRELRATLTAELPLEAKPPPPARAAPAVPEKPPPPLPHPEATCVQQTRARAVALALAEPERARSLVTRAGRSAWLPELSLRVSRRLGRREALDLPRGATSAPAPLGVDTADDVRYEARASWDLGRLVFHPEELSAQAQALRMADMRREIESLVHRYYFERRRLVHEVAPADDPAATIRRQVRIEELTAELDALSGGAFRTCIAPFAPAGHPTP